MKTVQDLINKVNQLFSDENIEGKVLLSTIHRAKGLEWPTVFLLDRDRYYPNKRASLPWQREQEKNLLYVALTRATTRVIVVHPGELPQVLSRLSRVPAPSA